MLLESSALLHCLQEYQEKGVLPPPTVMYHLLVAHPELVVDWRRYPYNHVGSGTKTQLLDSQMKVLSFEPCFSTATLVDTVLAEFDANSLESNHSSNSLPIRIAGASFLKPDRLYSADLAFQRHSKMILVDGASMIARPDDKQFPEEVKRLCTTETGDFLPDVFWSTAAAEMLRKPNFKSPFTKVVQALIDQTNIREIMDDCFKPDSQITPEKLIEILNECFRIFYTKIVPHTPISKDSRTYFPSGVIGCIDLLAASWASTGDIRIGYTYNKYAHVKTVNNYPKVNNFDAATLSLSYDQKLEMARWRAEMVGNIQGLPIEIETGNFSEDLVKSELIGNKSAVVMWTDGEDIQFDFPDQIQLIKRYLHPAHQSENLSPAGSLIVRDLLLYHFHLLHLQARYKKTLDRDTDFNLRTNKITPFLKKANSQPRWRNDDAAAIVGYYG